MCVFGGVKHVGEGGPLSVTFGVGLSDNMKQRRGTQTPPQYRRQSHHLKVVNGAFEDSDSASVPAAITPFVD